MVDNLTRVKRNPRNLAVDVLLNVITHGQSLTSAEPPLQRITDHRDQALARQLCFGVLRWLPRLRLIANSLLRKAFRQRDHDLQILLYIGLYQLELMRIPNHAAVAETVDCAKLRGKSWGSAVLNASLRRFLKERQLVTNSLKDHDEYRYAHPQWIIDYIRRDWPLEWAKVLHANNQQAPMTLRVNHLRNQRDTYLGLLKEAGIHASAACTATGVTLHKSVAVERLPGFSDGLVSVQDCAAQLAATVLGADSRHRVLDACCAPGGKTAHILESNAALKDLTAIDINPARMKMTKETLDRLKLKACLVTDDAADPERWWHGKLFDRILLDAPCSASGVIRRHPDIKILRRSKDIHNLIKQQARLLSALWPLLASGGRLLYATCSIVNDENDCQIQHFLEVTANASVIPIDVPWGYHTPNGRQILPGQMSMDGFYYALLKKSG